MKVDVTQVLQRFDGEGPFLTSPALVQGPDGTLHENPESKPLTLRKAVVLALDHMAEKMPLKKQLARHHLAKRVQRDDEPELSAANIIAIKAACADRYSPFLTGAICDLLEPGLTISEDDA